MFRGRRKRKVMRLQITGGQPNQQLTAGVSALTVDLRPVQSLLGGSVGGVNSYGAAHIVKDIVLHGVTWFSDVCITGGSPGNVPFFYVNEALWIQNAGWSGGLTYTPAFPTQWQNQNEWSNQEGVAAIPDKILFQRMGLIFKVAGSQMSLSNNWGVHHVRVRRRLEQADALTVSMDVFNQDTTAGNWDYNYTGILHLSYTT